MPVLKTLRRLHTKSRKMRISSRDCRMGTQPTLRLRPDVLTPVNPPATRPPPKPVTPGASVLPWVAWMLVLTPSLVTSPVSVHMVPLQ